MSSFLLGLQFAAAAMIVLLFLGFMLGAACSIILSSRISREREDDESVGAPEGAWHRNEVR